MDCHYFIISGIKIEGAFRPFGIDSEGRRCYIKLYVSKEAVGLSHQHQDHSHPPHTHQDPEISGFQLGLVIIFNFVITIVEVIGGLIAGSLDRKSVV
jgi:hypothetical protein